MAKKNKRQIEATNKKEGKITSQKTNQKRVRDMKKQKAKELRQKKRDQQSKESWINMIKNIESNANENSSNTKEETLTKKKANI
jgi:hypothetical protein